jgi:hypothetical protein
MASGDWGGGGASQIPRTVKRTENVTKKVTSSRPTRMEIPGDTPPLKYYSSPMYYKEPVDRDFAKNRAAATGRTKHGR